MKTKIAEPANLSNDRTAGEGRKLHGQLSPFSPQFAADSAVNLSPHFVERGSSLAFPLAVFPYRSTTAAKVNVPFIELAG